MPISAGLAAAASWVVLTRSFPMATPCSLTPCSAPHSQVGQESKAACAPVSPIVRYWVRSVHARRGAAAERPGDLDLAGRAVRVLGEHHAARARAHRACRTWSQCREVDRVARMQPRAVLAVDEIDLSDMEFWARPWDEREGAFQTLRRERPMPFFEEPEIPEALSYVDPQGHGLLRADAPRRHLARPAGTPRSTSRGGAPPPSSTCPRRCSTSSAP